MRVRRVTMTSVAAALVFVVTWLIKIPVPVSGGAYLNLGDSVIFVCAYILGGPLAAVSAGIGSAAADVAAGAAVYVLPTFVIKALTGLVAGALTASQKFGSYLFGCILGGAVMVAGYAAFEWGLFGAAYTAATLPFNLIQWCGSVLAAAALYRGARRLSSILGLRVRRSPEPQPVRH